MKRSGALAGAVALITLAACNGWPASQNSPSTSKGTRSISVPRLVSDSRRIGAVSTSDLRTVYVLLPGGADPQAAERVLRQAGLTVSNVPGTPIVIARGSTGAVSTAFGVHLYHWHQPRTGEEFFANDAPGRAPFPVVGVFGLDNAFQPRPLGDCAGFLPSTDCRMSFKAEQVRDAYGASALNTQGLKGDGQTVAILADSSNGYSQQAIDDFDKHNNLTTPTITTTDVGPRPVGPINPFSLPPQDWAWSGDSEFELEEDIEAVHAMADHASLHVYEMKSGATYFDFLSTVGQFGEHIASISFGVCEADLGPDLAPYADMTRILASAFEITVVASSGDVGAMCPSGTGGYQTGVLYPASDPSVTAVGGTHLDLGLLGNSRSTEEAWDQPDTLWKGPGSPPEASGGGVSALPRPPWQTKTGVKGNGRLVPDVAAMAAPGLTAAVNPSVNKGHPDNEWSEAGGTSLSAPLWAGVVAMIAQSAEQQGKKPAGLLNPLLYSSATLVPRLVGSSEQHALVDVVTSQSGGGDLAHPAAPGWDFATGLGVPDVGHLIPVLVAQLPSNGRPTGPPLDIRKVNWAEITVPAGTCGLPAPVQLHGGLATNISPPGGYRGFGTIAVVGPGAFGTAPGADLVYGDLAGDGRTQAAVLIGCDTGGFTASSGLGDSVLVYSVDPENHLLLLGVLPSTHMEFGSSGATGRLGNIQVVMGAVTADEYYYNSANEAGCCPTGLAHHTWPWKADGGFGPTLTPHG